MNTEFSTENTHSAALHPPGAAWWQALFDASEDALLVCASNGRIHASNPRADHLFAPSLQSPDPHLHHLLPESASRHLSALLQRNSGHQETLPTAAIHISPQTTMLADLQVTHLGDGFSLVAFKDASRRWRMESHVQRLIAAVDSTPDVFFLTDTDFRLVFVNAAFQSATGYTIEDALGKTADFLRAPGQDAYINEYLLDVSSGKDWTGELINRRNDGSLYPVETIISPIHDVRDQFLGYVACERDITIKKRLQDEVLLERDFAHSIINSIDSAIYTVDREFRITQVNDAWKRLPERHGALYVQNPPRRGDCLLDLVPEPGPRTELQELFNDVLARRQPRELRNQTPDGRNWAVRISPWTHAGEVSGLIYHVTDQTQFAQLQNQLFQAQKMETIGALAAGVAHDFNNVIQAIRGNATLLAIDESMPEALHPRLEQIDKAAARASEITRQLLSFSRASDEQPAVLDFNQVIREAGHLLRRTLRRQNRLKLDPADRPIPICMDATRAQQVLLNLCVNAQDAMPNGGQITIRNSLVRLSEVQAARTRQPAGTWFARCTVSDTGTGIPPELVPRIFEPFFTSKEKGKGTGLGLAIVQSAVNKAGGFIDLETAPLQGTSFHLYLPLAQGPVAPAPAPSVQALKSGSGRILLVDDLDLIVEFARNFLKKAGYDVLTASNAEEALEILESLERPVDLLLTDYSMPGKNGLQLLQTVSARWPEVRLVLASGFLEEHEYIQIEKEFGVRILNKPYHISEATALISELMSAPRRPGNPSDAEPHSDLPNTLSHA